MIIDDNLKANLVDAYHILAYLGLADHTYTHLSVKASKNSFYLNQFGLRFEEVTEDNLIEVRFDGSIINGYEKYYNKTGYITHSSVYTNRPDINYIFHIHTPYITAVSSIPQGLMPINQWALHFYNKIAYHSYDSLLLEDYNAGRMITDLGCKNIMLMRHHGALICGKTVQEAMFYVYHLEQACKTQHITLSMNNGYLPIPQEICEKSVRELLSFEEIIGSRDWEAWIRMIRRNENYNNRYK